MQEIFEYSKNQVDKAGKKAVSENITQTERDNCLCIIDKWRALHAFPMDEIAKNINKITKNKKDKIIVQRLKKLDTILDKLKRNHSDMRLSRMQDLGGCRVILPTIEDVYNLNNELKSKMNYKLRSEKDYIKAPNPKTGYRGIHLIYEFTDKKNPQNNGLLIEVQLRTKLQHLWATAVETVGMLTGNGLKFGQGDFKWISFFKNVSELFAVKEENKRINFLIEGKQIHNYLIDLLEDKNKILPKLAVYSTMNTEIEEFNNENNVGYYLLQLNIKMPRLIIEYFNNDTQSLNNAINTYIKVEKKRDWDIVLVAAKSINELKTAYPNYFTDIKEFTSIILDYLKNQISLVKQSADELSDDMGN